MAQRMDGPRVNRLEPSDQSRSRGHCLARKHRSGPHGAVRPPNILLDQHDHPELADFDSVAPLDSVQSVDCVARSFKSCRVGCLGGWGRYDVASEQSAFGSVLYSLVTGLELYEGSTPRPTTSCGISGSRYRAGHPSSAWS